MITVFPIVEGHGDGAAIPVLLRRIGIELIGGAHVECLPAYRLPRSRLFQSDELGKALELARRRLSERSSYVLRLILMDADDDCPKHLRGKLHEAHGAALGAVPTSIVFIEREFEAWFLAADWSGVLGGRLRNPTPSHVTNASVIRDAKGRFGSEFLVESASYRESVDQPKYTALVPFQGLRERAQSFDKLVRDLETLPRTVRPRFPTP
jgi:hypothetical protein